LFAHPDAVEAGKRALLEAKCAELGKANHQTIDAWIKEAVGRAKEWVLIGGPPCQAYSLAGRARMRLKDTEAFEKDKRHFLYREYLRIIKEFGPTVFVMENVKGMLTSQHKGSPIFERIMKDLQSPGDDRSYVVRSFVVDKEDLEPQDFVIRAEEYGIPQRRHRVILFGIRSDLFVAAKENAGHAKRFFLRSVNKQVSVRQVLDGLPQLRSRLSKEPDTQAFKAQSNASVGCRFEPMTLTWNENLPLDFKAWLHDPKLRGVLQHETRSHMRSDIHRYLFASCFAEMNDYSPKIGIYPPKLQPAHKNATSENVPFTDRFRVQLAGDPATTVVSHIAKDGHYYIHPDPAQCRSLTVREAARLQTFPDNYFFEGNRTQQYHQIGNAVPPYLARKIAEVVRDFIYELRN
jgi:DNA (cytosine-5)-methyltransferase 1